MASSSMDTEAAGHEPKGSDYTVSATAHAVDSDSWQQVGLLLVIGFNCAYVLSFSNLMMAPLGWGWGVACLLLVGAAAWYANWLLAGLHFIDGQRFIRYRDLMGFVFGRKMYYITYFLQFATLLLCNMGFILLGARALKAINVEFTHSPARLQWFIAATGIVYFAFAYFVPTISAMRNWLATSAALTLAYDVALLAILIRDGKSNSQKDFSVHGSPSEKVFNALGAVAAILVCNTSGLLPEIQSTVREPSVRGMRRALLLQYTAGAAGYYGISVAGYWAYGSSVSEYLPNQLGGPRWAAVLINAAAFLQSVVSQHVRRLRLFFSPSVRERSYMQTAANPSCTIESPLMRAAVRGADPRGDGHAAAAAGRGHVLPVQPDAPLLRAGAHLRLQRLRHGAVPVHGRLRQPRRLLLPRPAHLHVPQHGRPQDQGEEWWEMEQAVALGRHRFLHASLRRYHRRCSSFDLQQCQDLPLLRGHMIYILRVPLIILQNINGMDEQHRPMSL